ncbi:solute carrier family 12 member 9-like isoform X1 [Liolophura sinensis]
MISRALGPEFGGSIGFLFFIANVFSCALYISGFVEGVMENFGPSGEAPFLPGGTRWWDYLYASIIGLVCLIVCVIGGAMFARTLVFILLVVVICVIGVIVSFFAQKKNLPIDIPGNNPVVYPNGTEDTKTGLYTGLNSTTFSDNLLPGYEIDYKTGNMMNFASVFAILFSSVTGIMNGANMSGELKEPGRSIPRGTLSAAAFTFVTYLLLSFLIAATCDRYLLYNNYLFLQQINLWPPFVIVGIFAATLSAALGNLIGASRILEALGNDHLFWVILRPATITTKGGNPYVAVLISWVLVQLVLLIGQLNAIAPLVSVFFLLSYFSTNLACLALEAASAPNFRPTFKYFTWYTCAIGMIGCIVMCFLISAIYTSIAIIFMLVLIIVLHFQSLPTSWGSISQALIFHQVRKYLLMLDSRKEHVKYWRPQVLLMVSNPRQSCGVIDFINDIKKGGLYVLGHVKIGDLQQSGRDPVLEEYPHWLSLVDHLKIKAFVEITLAKNVVEGMHHLVRIAGLGGMKPNTICLGFYDNLEPKDTFGKAQKKKRVFFGSVEDGRQKDLEDAFPEIRHISDQKLVNRTEYVQLIVDALKMQKNVLLLRHFDKLDKKMLKTSNGKLYIDVWPVNVFRPETASYFDNTCLFMLQLACILNMVKEWRERTCLRVYLCVDATNDDTLKKEKRLDQFLRQLRILAQIKLVMWDTVVQKLNASDTEADRNEETPRPGTVLMTDFENVPDDYSREMNSLIMSNSVQTAVTFLYLPRPPSSQGNYSTYLEQLTTLSENLPPTVFVHGLHPVTSTTL